MWRQRVSLPEVTTNKESILGEKVAQLLNEAGWVREEVRKEGRRVGGICCLQRAGIGCDSLLYNSEYLTSPVQFSC